MGQALIDTFDSRMFTRPPGDKAYAGFMRRYDAEHPKQEVAAMKLPLGACGNTMRPRM